MDYKGWQASDLVRKGSTTSISSNEGDAAPRASQPIPTGSGRPSTPPDVLSDRFPVASAAVPLSDSLRLMVGASSYPQRVLDRLWEPPKKLWWDARDSQAGPSMSSSLSSSVGSLDQPFHDATINPSSLASENGRFAPLPDLPRCTSPKRSFSGVFKFAAIDRPSSG